MPVEILALWSSACCCDKCGSCRHIGVPQLHEHFVRCFRATYSDVFRHRVLTAKWSTDLNFLMENRPVWFVGKSCWAETLGKISTHEYIISPEFERKIHTLRLWRAVFRRFSSIPFSLSILVKWVIFDEKVRFWSRFSIFSIEIFAKILLCVLAMGGSHFPHVFRCYSTRTLKRFEFT